MSEPKKDTVRTTFPPPPVPAPSVAPDSAPSVNRGPKQETVRISILPRPGAGPVVINSRPLAPGDTIPRPLCWALFTLSAVIFLIQIWNYVVS